MVIFFLKLIIPPLPAILTQNAKAIPFSTVNSVLSTTVPIASTTQGNFNAFEVIFLKQTSPLKRSQFALYVRTQFLLISATIPVMNVIAICDYVHFAMMTIRTIGPPYINAPVEGSCTGKEGLYVNAESA